MGGKGWGVRLCLGGLCLGGRKGRRDKGKGGEGGKKEGRKKSRKEERKGRKKGREGRDTGSEGGRGQPTLTCLHAAARTLLSNRQARSMDAIIGFSNNDNG